MDDCAGPFLFSALLSLILGMAAWKDINDDWHVTPEYVDKASELCTPHDGWKTIEAERLNRPKITCRDGTRFETYPPVVYLVEPKS